MGPHPAVAAIRLAVRRVLNDLLTEYHHPLAEQPAGRPPRAELLERVGRATRAGRARQIRA
ncbi:tRNA lysidine(34) synthetase TilS, partial [Streptomyces sp. SID8014]|nr:tRNA lysidine(34) synthetase TilS [Streptomyces sp. SID8014]